MNYIQADKEADAPELSVGILNPSLISDSLREEGEGISEEAHQTNYPPHHAGVDSSQNESRETALLIVASISASSHFVFIHSKPERINHPVQIYLLAQFAQNQFEHVYVFL